VTPQSFNSLDTGDTSWVHYLDTTKIRFAGGYARPGLTTGLAEEQVVPGLTTDVYVLELGTNDIREAGKTGSDPGRAADRALKSLERLADRLGAPDPARVLVIAVGPMNDYPSQYIASFETEMRAGVRSRGWTYVDPWDGLHRPDARWLWRRDLTDDNVHPNAKGAKLLGKALQREILAAAR
jgi:lysophospholipase L1-like esterase